MGERKGTNKYYPPDYDPKKGGLNKFMGTHPLRERARKLHLGILIIRFEMPYNIWCEGCSNHIGMGVRYNAEKTKVGMYYSTPVYQFKMKCHLCDSHFEMKTDPGNLDYVIVSGARRQENRWNPEENGQIVPDDKRVIRQLADDAMFKLQHVVEDKSKQSSVAPTIGALEDLQVRWKDDYSANKAMRDLFRTKKKEIKAAEEKDKEFLVKRSLDIPLLQESEEDAKIASLIRLQPSQSLEERQIQKRLEIDRKSNFPCNITLYSGSMVDVNLLPSSTKHTHLNINHKAFAKQRSSLGIKLSTKSNKKTTETKDDEPQGSPFTAMEIDLSSHNDSFNNGLNKDTTLQHNVLPSNESDGREGLQDQWCINLLPRESTSSESSGFNSMENIETRTTEFQPRAIIISTPQLHCESKDYKKEENEEYKIKDSSTQSSDPELSSHPSFSSPKVPGGLSLVSCNYGSSSSGNEDD